MVSNESLARQAAQGIDRATFMVTVSPEQAGLIHRGDTIIVRDVITQPDGSLLLRLVTEDALRDVARNLLVD